MSDLMVLMAVAIAFWLGVPLVLRVLGAVLPILVTSLANAASVVGGAARGTMQRSRALFMENRSSVGEAVRLAAGSVYHMGEGVTIVWTDLMLAAATVAGLIGLPFTGENIHYDLLLGVSTVFSALVFAETGANLVGWVKTMPFSSVERGRIPAMLLAAAGFISSLLLLMTLAFYRSEMLAEDVNPTTVSAWINYLPSGILVAMATLLTIAASLAFTTLDTLFQTVAGIACSVVAVVFGVVAFVVRVGHLVVSLLLSVVNAAAAWWSEKSVVSEVVSTMSKGFVHRLNELVAVTPKKNEQAEVDPEDRELVGAAADKGVIPNRHRPEPFEFPG